MKIECKNIVDFCELISISIGQDIKDKCVFISSEKSYPSVSFENSKKDNIKFTYVFFTPLYTAIYSGNIKGNIHPNSYNLFYGIENWYREYKKWPHWGRS